VTPLSADVFADLMRDFTPSFEGRRVAVAVSGGPDSMTLAFCAKRWSDQQKAPPPLAFIVDHALRDESAAEAAMVRQRLTALGITAEILRWDHPPITSRLHSEARKARYRLLLDACHRHGIDALLFAHQREDQAETILMRLAKGTGIDGMAGIPAQSIMDGVRILRPFLKVPKESLIATCNAASVDFVTDPSNALQKFARGRLRRVMPLLAEEGLTVDRLVDGAARAAEARDALEHYTAALLRDGCRQDAWGVLHLDIAALTAAPRAIALRALSLALQAIHAEDYAPQHASVSALFDALQTHEMMPPRTLQGCLISRNKQRVTIMREFSNITHAPSIQLGESVEWDGRWWVRLQEMPQGQSALLTIKPLGHAQRDVLDRLAPTLRHKVPQGRVRASLPALWRGDELVGIPFLGARNIAKAELLPFGAPKT